VSQDNRDGGDLAPLIHDSEVANRSDYDVSEDVLLTEITELPLMVGRVAHTDFYEAMTTPTSINDARNHVQPELSNQQPRYGTFFDSSTQQYTGGYTALDHVLGHPNDGEGDSSNRETVDPNNFDQSQSAHSNTQHTNMFLESPRVLRVVNDVNSSPAYGATDVYFQIRILGRRRRIGTMHRTPLETIREEDEDEDEPGQRIVPHQLQKRRPNFLDSSSDEDKNKNNRPSSLDSSSSDGDKEENKEKEGGEDQESDEKPEKKSEMDDDDENDIDDYYYEDHDAEGSDKDNAENCDKGNNEGSKGKNNEDNNQDNNQDKDGSESGTQTSQHLQEQYVDTSDSDAEDGNAASDRSSPRKLAFRASALRKIVDAFFASNLWHNGPDLSLSFTSIFNSETYSQAGSLRIVVADVDDFQVPTIKFKDSDAHNAMSSEGLVPTPVQLNQSLLNPCQPQAHILRERWEYKTACIRKLCDDMARRDIGELEQEVFLFIGWVFDRIAANKFHGFQQILDHVDWALEQLSSHEAYSPLMQQLNSAARLLREWIDCPSSRMKDVVPERDPVWVDGWTPNTTEVGGFTFGRQQEHISVIPADLDELLAHCPLVPSEDDPNIPFNMQDAQAKYALWIANVDNVDPAGPYCAMLTHAHKVSIALLEEMKVSASLMETCTWFYLQAIQQGEYQIFDEIELLAAELDCFEEPSGLGNKSVTKVVEMVRVLFTALRPNEPLNSNRSRCKFLEAAQTWKTGIRKHKLDLELTAVPSLQDDNTYHVANRYWKTAFRCAQAIEEVHNSIPQPSSEPIEQLLGVEEMMWSLWVGRMHKNLARLRGFAEKIPPYFLPTADAFILHGLSYWEAKLSQKVCRVRALR
jgi:hypothetical protein